MCVIIVKWYCLFINAWQMLVSIVIAVFMCCLHRGLALHGVFDVLYV